MKYVMLLIVLMLLLCFGTAFAAELTVITVGTGNGLVEGEDIFCGSSCRANYEKGTVVHLKATPLNNSEFKGWRVNGKAHEGVIQIDDEDIIITAKFDLSNWEPDPLTLMWYNGNTKEWAQISVNEMAIFFNTAQWDELSITSQEDFYDAVQPIVHRFHSGATITEYNEAWMFLNSPRAFTKSQLVTLLGAFEEFSLVKHVSPVLYGIPGEFSTRTALTGEIIVEYPASYSEGKIRDIESEYRLTHRERSDPDLNFYLYRTGENSLELVSTTNSLYESGLVLSAYPNNLLMAETYASPNDPLFFKQWYLNNSGDTPAGEEGIDINVMPIWNEDCHEVPCRGTEHEVIAVVDEAVDLGHPDLALNVLLGGGNSWDYIGNDPNPAPDWSWLPERHGTAVAGIAAGYGYNGEGICGTAPRARFVGIRVIGGDPEKKADALTHRRDIVDIYNNSWGPARSSTSLRKLSNRMKKAMELGRTKGRGALGNIYVFAAGNDGTQSNTNYNPFANYRSVITVAASNCVDTWAPYSTIGATVLANAPSKDLDIGITTTDVPSKSAPERLYRHDFGGTSAATPQISGVVALMLQARPELTWRDIQHILILSADQNAEDADVNAAGYSHSYKLGFGRVNAKRAVDMARTWTLVEAEAEPATGNSKKNSISISENLKIEFIEVYFTSFHQPWGDLDITLKSPHNTSSILAQSHSTSFLGCSRNSDTYDNWRFGTVRHFGEDSQGDWTLEVEGGDLGYWELKIYGTELPPERSYVQKVTVSAGEGPIYSAGWEPLEELEQLAFSYYADPHATPAGERVQVEMLTSEALQEANEEGPGPAIRVSAEGGEPLEPCADPQGGRCWQGSLELPWGERRPRLTITGTDLHGNALLAFEDWEPKTLSEWTASDSEAGDRAHVLGGLFKAEWRVSAPGSQVSCETRDGRLTCRFEGGWIRLGADEADRRSLDFLSDPDAAPRRPRRRAASIGSPRMPAPRHSGSRFPPRWRRNVPGSRASRT